MDKLCLAHKYTDKDGNEKTTWETVGFLKKTKEGSKAKLCVSLAGTFGALCEKLTGTKTLMVFAEKENKKE